MDLMLVAVAVLAVWVVFAIVVVVGLGYSIARDQRVDVGRVKPELARTRRG